MASADVPASADEEKPERDASGGPDAATADATEGGIDADEVATVLFVEPLARKSALASCAGEGASATSCLLRARYVEDDEAATIALDVFERTGSIVGVLPRQEMDGGYRGLLQLAPVLPVGPLRRHLAWVRDALVETDRFVEAIAARATKPPSYRWRDLEVRFFRSEHAHTPAAFAHDDTVAYNVSGSLNVSGDAVRETLFHEIFHLNDQAHDDWSPRALGDVYDAVVAKCGTSPACLRPFAPNDTMVRNGTYYAFQPGNGVREYAAELAIRYFREQRARLRGERLRQKAFKCGPDANARAWRLFVDAFFAGVDLVPPCAR